MAFRPAALPRSTRALAAVRATVRAAAPEGGYTLTELLVVMAILGTVLAALSGLIVSGTGSQVDLSDRVQAQTDAVTALDRLRRDVHCSSSATAASATSVTLANSCAPGGVVSWCTATLAGGRFALYRRPAAGSCGAADIRYADFLTNGSVFAYETASTNNLARLRVNLPVRVNGMTSTYTLCDILVMRNSSRVGTPGAAVAPCV